MEKKTYIFLTVLLFLCITFRAQELDKNKKYHSVGVGFWNVENFYDTLNDPIKNDEDWLPTGANLWDSKKYYTKLDHLSDVISQLGTEVTPDGVAVMGLCEIENIHVLNDLVKMPKLAPRHYKIVHVEGPDIRGVDVALLYNPKYFTVTSHHAYHLTLPLDSSHKTRDQLLVSGKLLGEEFHFIICHWPSRLGGEVASQPNRIAAAKLGRKIIDSLLKTNPNAKVILMGDLNDDPTDVSVRQYLNTVGKPEKMEPGKMFNAMESHYKKGIGTLAYNDAWNLFDQQIMTPALVKNNYQDLQFYVSHVFNKPFVLESEGKFRGYPRRTFSGGAYTGGYSDHFSVFSILLKEIK
ncbi:MAG TPA: endonuclease/exonuclease/phosphatase family protein [Bacteroidia bacterium]|nr:endonuclease/exonuclease/phosphatase family protein [Bacteroidia bacterium]